MSTVALPRTAKAGSYVLREPALLVPVVGAAILVYLAVLPLFMLVMGSFQAEVAPREFVYTLKNYHAAYASEYTYSTFRNSLIFASGSAALSFLFGPLLAWLTERTNRINSTDAAVGTSKRKVTRRKVCQVLAPDIIADSSNDGSIDLKAATIMRNASGTCPTECTQIIPGREKTLNGMDCRPNKSLNQTFR